MSRNSLLGLFIPAGVLSYNAAMHERFPGDISLTLLLQEVSSPVFKAFMEAVTLLGVGWVMLGLTSIVAMAFLLFQRRVAWYRVSGILLLMGFSPLLKLLIDRPRPSPDLVQVFQDFGGLAFPSGHAFQSMVLFGFLVYMCGLLIRRRWLRIGCQGFLIVLLFSVGLSRVYLGAHWSSDVLGGFFLGALFLALLLTLGKATPAEPAVLSEARGTLVAGRGLRLPARSEAGQG